MAGTPEGARKAREKLSDEAKALGLTVAEYRARRRASAETHPTPTIVQVEPERLDARVTPPVETSPQPVAADPVAEPVAVAPSTEPEKPRDPVALWQVHPVLQPDPLYPEMTSAPFGFERRGGRAYVLRLGRRLEVTPWFPWSAETSSTLYLDRDGRVYQDVQPVGWEPKVIERRPLIDSRRAT